MELWAMIGLTVVAALLCVLLKKHQPEQGVAIGVATGVLLLLALLPRIKPLVQTVQDMIEMSSATWEYGEILFKGLGVCLLTQTAADTCRDAGEGALASKAELCGKVALLLLALPLFEKVAALALELCGGGQGAG